MAGALAASLEAAENDRAAADEQEERRALRADDRAYWRERMGFTTKELTPREAAVKDLLRERDFDLEIVRAELAHLRMTLKRAEKAGDPDIIAKADTPRPTPAITPVPLLTLFNAYAKEQALKPNTAGEWKAMLTALTTFLGHDDAARITAIDLDRWRDALLTEKTKAGKLRDPLTVKSKYFTALRATLNYGVEKRKLPENVARTVVVRVPRKAKLRERDFTRDEANTILAATYSKPSANLSAELALARRWIPWLCAYTGARVNEIGQLRGSDVQLREGIWTIRITPEAGTVKANVARVVPLHSHLIEQGFPAIATAKGDDPIFYAPDRVRKPGEGNSHFKKVGEKLAEWVRNDVGINDPQLQPNHAWRHTFKTLTREANISERIADAVQGHAPRSVGQSYGSVPLRTLSEAIEKLPRFEPEKWPA